MGFAAPTVAINTDTTKRRISSYTVTEDATPIDPNDTTGGAGQMTFAVKDTSKSKALRKRIATLTDGAQGITSGTISGLTGDGVTLTATADSRMVALNVIRTAQPYTGSLAGCLNNYLGLVGLSTGIVIDPAITAATRTNLYTNPSMETTGALAVTRTNQAQNPVPTSATGWSAANTPIVTVMSDGVTPCLETTSTGATTPYIWSTSGAAAVASGDVYVLSAMIEIVGDVAGSVYTVRGHGITGNVYFGSGSIAYPGDTVGPQRVTIICTPNAAVLANEFGLTIVRTGLSAAGVKLRMGKVQIEKATVAGSPVQFDGSTAASSDFSYAFTGPANASTSTEKALGVFGVTPTGGTASSATNERHSGTRSARIMTAGAVAGEGFLGTAISGSAHANVPVAAGVWVKAPAGALLYLVVRMTGAAVSDFKTNFTCTGAWQWVTVTHAADAAGTTVQVHVRTQSTQAVTFYVDDVIVEELPTTVGYFDGTTTGTLVAGAWTSAPNASTSTLSPITVSIPGWKAVVWDQLKKLCAQYDIELSLVSNNIVARPIRQRIAKNTRDSQVTWTVNDTNLAQSIEVYYFQNTQVTNGLIYPLGGWNSTVTPYQVDAGQVLEVDIPLYPNSGDIGPGASLTSVVQPTCVTNVGPTDSNASVYTVVGNDGLPVTPAAWGAGGGSVVVSINDDTRSIHLKITGSSVAQYAPYQLAMASGTSNSYSSLRILGTGVFTNKKKIVLHTGLGPDTAPQEIGASVENEFISSYHDAIDAGMRTLVAFTGPAETLSVTTKGINRASDSGSYAYPTIGAFDTQYAGMTVAQFNTLYAGKTIADFNADQIATVSGAFANQAFGNIAGARVYNDGAWYRIRTASITPSGITYTAERDTTVDDFNTRYAGMTIAQFNALWAGATLGDYALQPLKKA